MEDLQAIQDRARQDLARVQSSIESDPEKPQDADTPGLIERLVKSPQTYRTLLETGLMIAAPEIAAPKAMLAAGKGAYALAHRMLTSFAGGASGSLLSEPFDPSENPGTAAAATGLAGMAGEAGGALLEKGISKALTPGVSKLEPGAAMTAARLEPSGGILSPAKATSSRFFDILENVADVSLFGGGGMSKNLKRAQDIISKQAEDFAGSFSKMATKEDAGVLIRDLVNDGMAAFKSQARANYSKIDGIVDSGVSLSKLKDLAKQIKIDLQAGLPSGSPGTKTVVDDIIEKADVVTFGEASSLRSDLLSIGRHATDLIPGKAQAAAKRMSSILDADMQEAARVLDPAALAEWRAANNFWKDGKKTFDNSLIKSLMRKEPEMVFDAAIKNGKPGTIRRLREISGGGAEWEAVQGQFLSDLLRKSSNEVGELSGVSLLKNVNKFGDDTLKELFPNAANRQNIYELAQAMRLTQTKPQDTAMRLATQFAQVGAGIAIYTGDLDPTDEKAIAIFLGPYALSKALTNKAIVKWLTIGIKAPKGTNVGSQAVSKLTAELSKNGLLQTQPVTPPIR